MAWLGPADLALQQGVWWAGVLLGARDRPLLGGAAGLLAVLVHLALRPAERPRLLRAALTAAAFGFATDSALSAAASDRRPARPSRAAAALPGAREGTWP